MRLGALNHIKILRHVREHVSILTNLTINFSISTIIERLHTLARRSHTKVIHVETQLDTPLFELLEVPSGGLLLRKLSRIAVKLIQAS